MAVSLPKGGEMNRIMIPDTMYHAKTRAGPSGPTNSESFLENRMMSRTGFVKLRYREARACDHLSRS
jgi:hypothetical protein